MKNIKQKMAVTLATLIVFAGFAAKADTSATLFLEGYIETITELYIDPVIGAATTLNIVGGETARNIAAVTETSNNPDGYEILMASENAGLLTHTNGTSNTAYSIAYDGAATAVQPTAVGSEVTVKTVAGPLAGTVTDTSPVDITVTAGGALPAGAYTDTLIFTMQAL